MLTLLSKGLLLLYLLNLHKYMKIIDILNKTLNLRLEVDSYFICNGQYSFAEFEYHQLKNSIFGFDYQKKKVLHFTSVESARLILENKYLRGSNFNDFDDEFEILNSLIKIKESFANDWYNIKERTFAISFTEKVNDSVQENYEFHWAKYANQNRGVALEFEFIDSILSYRFYPLKIFYLGENNSVIKKIRKEMVGDEVLSEAEKEFILPILASIKERDKYWQDKEVRLLYRISDSDIEHLTNSDKETVFFSFDKRNKIKLELRVPFSTPKDDADDCFLRLNRIYLGKNYINSEDNISSCLLMNSFENRCTEEQIELKY